MRAIEALFGGLAGTHPWDEFLLMLRSIFRADFATLILTPPGAKRPGQILTPGAPAEQVERYAAEFFTADPFTGLPEGKVTTFHEFVGGRAVVDPEFAHWLMEYSSQVLGVDIRAPSGFEARLRITRATGPQYGLQDSRALARLVPHLRNAVSLYQRLEANRSEQAIYSGAIEQLSVGVLVLDHDGRVLRSNGIADEILGARDGISGSEQRVRFAKAEHRDLLDAILAEPAAAPRAGPHAIMRIERPSGLRDYGIAVHRIDTPIFMRTGASPAVALLISDPEREVVTDVPALRARFGLTRMEAELAGEIVSGRSLDEAAARLGIARNTARSHLRGIFAKTGVSRQGELVRLVHSALPGLGREN